MSRYIVLSKWRYNEKNNRFTTTILLDELDNIYIKTKYNGSYGLVDESGLIYKNSFGFSDLEQSHSFQSTTKTCLASLTKQFTATALLILESKNMVSLDTFLSEYYPEYIYSNEITLLDMLNMMSGIPSLHNFVYEKSLLESSQSGFSESKSHYLATIELEKSIGTTESLINSLNERPLDFRPGSQFSYCNENYELLGGVITKITGKPFGCFFEEKIFRPLEMFDTSTIARDSQTESYRLVDGEKKRLTAGSLSSADGGMVSTVDDMMKWIQGILKQKILSKEKWNAIFDFQNREYQFGWMKLGDWYYHGGEYLGFSSEIFIHQEAKIGKIMLSNLESIQDLDQISMDERSEWRNRIVELYL